MLLRWSEFRAHCSSIWHTHLLIGIVFPRLEILCFTFLVCWTKNCPSVWSSYNTGLRTWTIHACNIVNIRCKFVALPLTLFQGKYFNTANRHLKKLKIKLRFLAILCSFNLFLRDGKFYPHSKEDVGKPVATAVTIDVWGHQAYFQVKLL